MRKIETISKKLVDILLAENIIGESDVDFYQYGFQLLIASLLDAVWVIFIGFVLDEVFVALVYVLILITVRTQLGGFHASTYFRCFLCYTFFFIISIIIVKFCAVLQISFAELMLLSFFLLILEYIFAPLPHRKKLDRQERKVFKYKGMIRTAVWFVAMVVVWNHNTRWSYSIFSVLLMCILLMLSELSKWKM